MYTAKIYRSNSKREISNKKVFVYLITSPQEVLKKENNPILKALKEYSLAQSVGIYFYRFKNLGSYNAFSKIGEVSRIDGLEKRFTRGWHGTNTYSDTYLSKGIFNDISLIFKSNPMYFVFYELDLLNSFPKIDEMAAFQKHLDHFKRLTRNNERTNGNFQLGRNLVWHNTAFNEVLNLEFPDGVSYPF